MNSKLIKEDGEGSVPTNTTANGGTELTSPKLPIKPENLTKLKSIIRRKAPRTAQDRPLE